MNRLEASQKPADQVTLVVRSLSWIAAKCAAVFARPAAAWIVLGGCLLATALVSGFSYRQVSEREQARFRRRVEGLEKALAGHMQDYFQVLRAAAGLWAVHPSLTREEWKRYYESLDLARICPGIKALAYVERMEDSTLPGSGVHLDPEPPPEAGVPLARFWPPGPRTNYYIVRFIEPLAANRTALDYDIGSEPTRRQAAEAACDTGEPTLSGRLELVQARGTPGLLLFMPIYTPGAKPASPLERRQALRGWVDAAMVVRDLMTEVCRSSGDDLDCDLFDGTARSAATLLYSKAGQGWNPQRSQRPRLTQTTRMVFGGRAWTLHSMSTLAFEEAQGYTVPWLLALSGLCISLLLFGAAHTLVVTHRAAIALADQMLAKVRLQDRAIKSSHNGILIIDASRADHPITYANPALAKMTGRSETECLRESITSLFSPAAEVAEPPHLKTALRLGQTCGNILRVTRKDGTAFWADLSLSPVRDEDGRVTHYLGIVEDVTERKRAEEDLAAVERRFHELVDNLRIGVYRNTPGEQGRFLEANPALVAMVEADSKEALLRCRVSDFYVDPVRRQEFSEKLSRQGFVKNEEIELKSLKGRRFWAAVTAVMKRDKAGTVFFDGVIEDITERRRALEALRQSQEALTRTVQQLRASHEELQRTQLELIQAAKLESIGTLAAGVAHEVKNPLQSILMGLDFLANNLSEAAPTAREVLEDMRDAVRRANAIIKEMLEFSASTQFSPEGKDLNALVERSLHLLNPEIVATRTQVVRHLQPGLPKVRIDPGKLQQVFVNLFVNALQAMPQQGTLCVTTRSGCLGQDLEPDGEAASKFQRGERLVVAEVRDTGPGIPKEHLGRIFDPFFTTKPVGVGTGLGLSVVRRIVDLHGGAIAVRNAPEGGAVVTLVLRACQDDSGAGQPHGAAQNGEGDFSL